MGSTECINWHPRLEIQKWHREEDRLAGLPPDAVELYDGNLLLNAGIDRLLDLLKGAGGQVMDATHCRIGVGNDATAAVATQTDLIAANGASTRQWKLVNVGPTRTAETLTYSATFGSAEANFTWAEWGTDFGTADGTSGSTAPMLNRKVQAMGTKASGSSWTTNVSITVA